MNAKQFTLFSGLVSTNKAFGIDLYFINALMIIV